MKKREGRRKKVENVKKESNKEVVVKKMGDYNEEEEEEVRVEQEEKEKGRTRR